MAKGRAPHTGRRSTRGHLPDSFAIGFRVKSGGSRYARGAMSVFLRERRARGTERGRGSPRYDSINSNSQHMGEGTLGSP